LARAFGFEGFDVAGAVDEELDQLGEGGGVAGGAEGWLLAVLVGRDFCRVRLKIGIGWDWFPRSPSARDRGHPVLSLRFGGWFGHLEERAFGCGGEGGKAAGVEQGELIGVAAEVEACRGIFLRG